MMTRFLLENDIKSIRPGFGLHPKYFNEIVGTKVKNDKLFGDRVELNEIIFQ